MKKSELYGSIGSTVLIGLLILLLFLLVMPGQKLPDDEGIMVSFGDVDMGSGRTETPQPEPIQRTSAPPIVTPKIPKEEVMTQDDQSVAIENERKRRERNEREELRRKQQEERRIADERKQREQEAVDKASALSGLFGNNKSSGSGTTSGDSRQGNPAGSGNSGGNSWSLSGRSLTGNLIEPAYENDVEGRITVSIRVDANGTVVSASIGSPTNISDATTRNAAISAAKRTRFSQGEGISAGSITYNFKLR